MDISENVRRAANLILPEKGEPAWELAYHLTEIHDSLGKLRDVFGHFEAVETAEVARDAVQDIGEELSHLIWHIGDCPALRLYLERYADWRNEEVLAAPPPARG